MLFTACSAISTHSCFGMEEKKEENVLHFKRINNGLLTRITAITIATYSSMNKYKYTPDLQPTLQLQNNTLINLMQGKSSECEKTDYFGNYNRYTCHETFQPLIIEQSGNDFIDLGKFNRKTHKEVKEAIRQNKAIYTTIDQGVIVYNLDQQPNVEQWTTDEIEAFMQILTDNYQDM
jgi:hypothetical protein